MNSGSDGAGPAVEVGGSGRVTGAESEGRLSSVTTSGLEVEVISPAVETSGETVVEIVVEIVVETVVETVVEGLERSGKMLSLSVNKLSLELAGVSVVPPVSVIVRVGGLSVATGAMVAGLGRTVWSGLVVG